MQGHHLWPTLRYPRDKQAATKLQRSQIDDEQIVLVAIVQFFAFHQHLFRLDGIEVEQRRIKSRIHIEEQLTRPSPSGFRFGWIVLAKRNESTSFKLDYQSLERLIHQMVF